MNVDEPTRSPMSRFFRAALRIGLAALIGIGLGAAAYYGVPRAYRDLVEPVRENSSRIETLQVELNQARVDLAELSDRSSQRISELEAGVAAGQETLAELQASSQLQRTELDQQLQRLGTRLDRLDQALSSQSDALDLALATPTAPDPELLRQLKFTRAALHLLRARLWLVENNLGLAGDEVQQARDALSELEGMELVLERLDQALADFALAPLVAADDLEIAWKLLTAPEPPGE